MKMEDAPLNKAHQEYRFAERHLRYRRFDEAIQSHQKAAVYLTEAMKLTSSAKAFESMQCQYEYHLRQQEVVRLKKQEYENYLKAIENHRTKITNMLLSSDIENNKHNDNLQLAIYKTMNQADSLLGLLVHKDQDQVDNAVTDNSDNVDTNKSSETASPTSVTGSKCPKGEETVIEELRTLNTQLHILISQLINQLELKNKENEILKEKVKTLEEEKSSWTIAANVSSRSNQNVLKVNIDSGGTSPLAFSPCSEIGIPELLVESVEKVKLDEQN